LVEDPKWELAILATVQGFYEKLLQEHVAGEVPVPAGLEVVSLQESDDNILGTLNRMHRWLRLLDMAITPAMLRRAFTPDTDPEIAEAMLRYFSRKRDGSAANRDKTDLISTFLYRHPRVPGQWEQRGYGLDGSIPLSPFEIALLEILSDADVPALSDEHVQILREFDTLQAEAQGFKDLSALLESDIIGRVRRLKESLDDAFFHPGALATVAPYNAAFGRKFDELFLNAAHEIKSFADALEQQGGHILGTVEGVDVTVDHVAALRENELLKVDYSSALDKFRRVSKLRTVLEQRPPIRLAPKLVRPSARQTTSGAKTGATPQIRPGDADALRAAVTPQQISTEEGKLLRIEESVRAFVQVADPKFRRIVPMRYFNLILSPAEADAFRADYLGEKSLRAGVARVLLRLVAVSARMTAEFEELKRSENSHSLWKLHADSLIVLLEIGQRVAENAGRVLRLAEQHGSRKEVETITDSVQKLRTCTESVEKVLAGTSDGDAMAATASS
jgi:hypothetical protein